MRRAAWVAAALLAAGCAGGPVPPAWKLESSQSQRLFERHWLAGNAAAADADFRDARQAVSRTGRLDLLARLELARCALRVASLDFDACTPFEALRADAGPEELAYADYLYGGGSRRAAPAEGDALAQLVDAGVRLRRGELAPEGVARATGIASSEGWRRPLAAWLALQKKRAEEAGDRDAAARLGRRLEAVLSSGGG